MKNFLIAFSVFLVWSFFGLWLYSWLQPIDTNTNNREEIATNEATDEGLKIDDPLQLERPNDLTVEARDTMGLIENEDPPILTLDVPSGLKATAPNGDPVFQFPEGISIWKSTDQIKYATAIADFKYKLLEYLQEHPDEELHIASLYSASENIENPNFGFQRGEKVKNILSKAGIPKEKMVVKTLIREIDFDENDMFKDGIYFSLQPLDEERVKILKLSLPDTKTIYPKLVNNEIFVNKELQDLLAEVKSAVALDPDLTIEIIGHTDNIGNANDNYLVGLRHARQIRWYLVAKGGIDRKKITAISAGESKSIASNQTERGRLLNRRIEINFNTN